MEDMDITTEATEEIKPDEMEEDAEPFLGYQTDDGVYFRTVINGYTYEMKPWQASRCYQRRDKLLKTLGIGSIRALSDIPGAIGEVAMMVGEKGFSSDESREQIQAIGALLLSAIEGALQGILGGGGLYGLQQDVLDSSVCRIEDVNGAEKRVPVRSKRDEATRSARRPAGDTSSRESSFEEFYKGRIFDLDRLMCWVLWVNLSDFLQGLQSIGKTRTKKK